MTLLDRLVAAWRSEQPASALVVPSVQGMGRRRFLQVLGGSVAVAAAAPFVDLEALIWTPGQSVAVGEVGSGIFLTAEWITREALKILERNLQLVTTVNRAYDERFHAAVILNPMGEIDTPRFGVDTVADWHSRYRPQLEASASLRDAPLPMDALTRQHVHILQPNGTVADSVVNMTGKMTIKAMTRNGRVYL